MSSVASVDAAKQLAHDIAGQQLLIPSLWHWLADWPAAVNQNLERLRPVVDTIIDSSIIDEEKRNHIKRHDFALLAALMYPRAEWRELQIVAAYKVWVFIWDDEIDLGQSETALDKEKTGQYCKKSLAYIRHVLQLDTDNGTDIGLHHSPYKCMAAFKEVCDGLVETADADQRERIFRELEIYISQVVIEQGRQQDGKLPTLEEYVSMRMGSVGVTPYIACFEATNRIQLPRSVMDSKEMSIIWEETTMLSLVINDIYSCQKEIASGSIQNLVPVMWNETKNMGHVVVDIISILKESVKKFERAFKMLEGQTSLDSKLDNDMKAFVDNCRTWVTGLLEWTLTSERYKMYQYLHQDGSVVVPL
ncbi:isoprenoid synthase domain-containing protein [Penicillium manginii]|uniref:isoprenoid synthase domain-containing protein n=1 Tax=Penicillium manginii TaxID=203109 RepID=UPI002546D78A|nr:isoprenoid synthase domain-containing protein [Penicillium manginii]KAJ5743504.1 isoprenoid synthase domain-containing protein [Penicillium manginii]